MMPNKQPQSQFSRQFAHLFTSTTLLHFRSSPAVLPTFRDGTDPLSGGQSGAFDGSHGGPA